MFDTAVPYRVNNVTLRELLVRRAEVPESDTESLDDSDSEDDTPSTSNAPNGPIPRVYQFWVKPPAPPAPKPFLATGIRVARPGAPPDPRPPTFTHWITPPAPPAPKPFLATGIRCAPAQRAKITPREIRQKPSRAEVEERQRLKKRAHDRRVRSQHREERRLEAGSRLKGVTHPAHYALPVASSGWMGIRQDEPDAREYGLDEFPDGSDFVKYNWNGVPQPILDSEDRVLLVLGGFPPNAPDWEASVATEAATAMENAAKEVYTEPKWLRKTQRHHPATFPSAVPMRQRVLAP
ncbi:hypothetical protein B0H13DRAFT_2390515 [Mycena leptocephala]|nr:hypothetical protein B0H13DRAFT_2390515 [Mycena leptocephala]